MRNKAPGFFVISACGLVLATCTATAEPPGAVALPKPDRQGGMPLMQALSERKSQREFEPKELSRQMLSNLLWAAYGVNRPDGHRTAPSAMNRQTVDIYVVMREGAYVYDAAHQQLLPVATGDLRAATGTQDFPAQAPLNLVYVADYAKLGTSPEADKTLYTGAETGFIGQNVYLFCASEGLATVVRASVNRETLAKALKLRPEQKIVLAQTVGYPKAKP
jgi:SagB-type dehydrogenase family enzyme